MKNIKTYSDMINDKELDAKALALFNELYEKINNLSDKEIQKYMADVRDSLSLPEEPQIVEYFIPVRNEPTRIECVYPSFVLLDDSSIVTKFGALRQKKLDDLLKATTQTQITKADPEPPRPARPTLPEGPPMRVNNDDSIGIF